MTTSSTTSEQILRSARQLVIAGGYSGFSYADIASEVGIRKASIHHHFPTKVDLVRSLVIRHREDTDEGMASLARNYSDPVERLRAYTGYWANCIGDATNTFCVCAQLASQIPALPPEIVVEVQAYFRALSTWIAAALASGEKQGILVLTGTAKSEAEFFMAAVHGAMLSARTYADAAVFELVTDRLVQNLLPSEQHRAARAKLKPVK
jgi:TetR/AcrR family transcriptional repressor of nem operon